MVLPHQHFLGDSSSLSDSLCRTDKARFYSTGIHVIVKTTLVSRSLTTPAMSKCSQETAPIVLEETREALLEDAGVVG